MAVPEGARRVRYNVSTVDDAPWLTWIFESDLPGGAAKQVVDEALQMAAEHVIDWLSAEYPSARVVASRMYTGRLEGDAWPEGEEGVCAGCLRRVGGGGGGRAVWGVRGGRSRGCARGGGRCPGGCPPMRRLWSWAPTWAGRLGGC